METGNRFRTLDEPTRHLPFQMSENMFCTHGRLNMKNGKPPLFRLFHDFALRQGALHIRKLPQAGKHSLRRTSAKRNPVAAPQQKNSPPFLTPRFLLRLDGKSGSGPIPETEAKLRKRTFRAFRCAVRQTDRRAEFHQALRKIAAAPRRIDRFQA